MEHTLNKTFEWRRPLQWLGAASAAIAVMAVARYLSCRAHGIREREQRLDEALADSMDCSDAVAVY
jgi:hypothetical protein